MDLLNAANLEAHLSGFAPDRHLVLMDALLVSIGYGVLRDRSLVREALRRSQRIMTLGAGINSFPRAICTRLTNDRG